MRVEDVGAAIAARSLAAVGPVGLKSAHYPAPGYQPHTPALVLWLRRGPITPGDHQLWFVTFEGWILVEEDPGLHKAVAVADPLIVPLVDAFATQTDNYTLDGQVDFCTVTGFEIPDGSRVYGDGLYYSPTLTWTVKLHRFAGDA